MNSVLVSDDSSFGATPDFNLIPGIFTFTPERSDAALRGPYRTGFIGSEFVNLKFTHEELNVPEAYKGQVFKVLGSLYCSFRSGGYEGAPAAFAHILPLGMVTLLANILHGY